MSPPRILLDCDPGQDDAIAILCAARYSELVGITTVSGNVSLDKTTTNALLVAQLMGLDVEVHAGASRPLVAEPSFADHVHGESGLDGPSFPPLRRAPASDDAVTFILDNAADDVWLVPIGPLTNVAHALDRDPT
ncbi:MAG: nucleoside hydrolase, partial [Acidimicrobiales bacterium]